MSDIFKDKWITKPISDLIIRKNGFSYYSTTKRVSENDIQNICITKINFAGSVECNISMAMECLHLYHIIIQNYAKEPWPYD